MPAKLGPLVGRPDLGRHIGPQVGNGFRALQNSLFDSSPITNIAYTLPSLKTFTASAIDSTNTCGGYLTHPF